MNGKFFLLLLSFFLFSACKTQNHFKNVVTYSEGRQKAQESNLKFSIQFQKIRKDRSKGVSVDILEFTMQLENKGMSPIYFQPRKYVLMDDEGSRFHPSTVSPGGNLCIWPNKIPVKLTITYRMPVDYWLSRIGSFRLFWNFRIHSRVYRRISKFLRYKVEYRYRKVYLHPFDYPYYYRGFYHRDRRFHRRRR